MVMTLYSLLLAMSQTIFLEENNKSNQILYL